MAKPIYISKIIKKFNSKITAIPGDKSISIRAVLISSLGIGKSIIKGLPNSEDVKSSIKCCQKLGILIKRKKKYN